MADIDKFVEAVYYVYFDHGIYLWGGNGELTRSLTIGKIIQMETNLNNAARVLKHISELLRQGEDLELSRAVDCSGLVVYALRSCGAVSKDFDTTAKGLQKKCEAVELTKLRKGDLVFNKKKDASHVGIFDGNLVIESQGRDRGVTRRDISAGSWVIGGRLPYFK